jgi:hypothetical protein
MYFFERSVAMSYPQSTKDQFLTLRAEGHTYAQIAKELKVSRHTLIVWGKTCKVHLDADRAIDQEALLDQLQEILSNVVDKNIFKRRFP